MIDLNGSQMMLYHNGSHILCRTDDTLYSQDRLSRLAEIVYIESDRWAGEVLPIWLCGADRQIASQRLLAQAGHKLIN